MRNHVTQWNDEQDRVQAVHDSAMARKQVAHVLDAQFALDGFHPCVHVVHYQPLLGRVEVLRGIDVDEGRRVRDASRGVGCLV